MKSFNKASELKKLVFKVRKNFSKKDQQRLLDIGKDLVKENMYYIPQGLGKTVKSSLLQTKAKHKSQESIKKR